MHKRREESSSSSPADCFARCLPAVLLPLLVAGMHPQSGVAKLPLVFVAAACGVVIAFAVPKLRYSLLVVVLALVLLLSVAYLQELQVDLPGHHLPHAQHLGRRRSPEELRQLAPGALERRAPADAEEALVAVATPAPPAVAPAMGRQAAERVAALRERAVPLPSSAELAPEHLETLSVVLPCAFEGSFAPKTVEAILKHTKLERLKEIIVVDDGSRPPLQGVFPPEMLTRTDPPVRIIRHERTQGLIGAKKSGGDAARGDVIVFFDCHISPRDGWEDAFLKQMTRAGDHRTVVVPTITSLDPDTWEEIHGGANGQACYVLWNADFTWLTRPGRDVPLMSGGLLAMSRRWWQETEGYDEHMVAWGGENIDQSLRIWLCGGRIEVAEGAFVAHMWRDPKNAKTQLRYPIPTKDVMRNKARAVKAWFGNFSDKVFTFPEYEQFTKRHESLGDMTNFESLKSKLKCAPFSSYIHRFSYVYLDTGLVPEEIFQIRETSSDLCLERQPQPSQPHLLALAPCSGGGGSEGPTSELQLWHLGNRDTRKHGKACCSGLMNWNFLQCLDAQAVGAQVRTFECTISGDSVNQNFLLEGPGGSAQLKWRDSLKGGGCVGPQQATMGESRLRSGGECQLEAMDVGAVSGGGARNFRLRSVQPPGSKHRELCATALAAHRDANSASGFDLGYLPCDEADSQQILHGTSKFGGLEVRVGDTENCLDSASGTAVLVYPCYDESVHNMNQIWHLERGRLVWKGQHGSSCADVHLLEKQEDELSAGFTLQTCAPKVGQRLKRQDVQQDGTFLLKDPDLGSCLGASDANAPHGGKSLALFECGEDHRWREKASSEQVQHVASGLCLDGGQGSSGDMVKLFMCHRPTAQSPQRFEIIDVPGWVQWKMNWGDNGRKRWFERCLDRQPVKQLPLAVHPCKKTTKLGLRWEKLNARKPIERQAWDQVEKPGPDAPPLGGPFKPP